MTKLSHQPEGIRPPSLVPPAVAALLSLLIPGLGQMLARSVRRGLIILFSYISIIGLLIWRFNLAAPRDTGWLNIIKKGLKLDNSLVIASILTLIMVIWIALDAYSLARDRERTPIGVFFMIIVVFFALGWQIGQISLVELVTQADEAGPPLARVIWPWEKAIVREEDLIQAYADIQVPCVGEAPAPNQLSGNEPVLIATPTCGELSTQAGKVGTTLHLEGYNFVPDSEVAIKWEDPLGNVFRQRQGGEYITVTTDSKGHFALDIIMPYRLLPPSATEPFYIWQVFGEQVASVGPAKLSPDFKLVVEKMIETIFIGMMATFFGVTLAVPVSFFAARNLMSTSPITLVIYYLTRGVLNIIRSIEPLIWAIIAVIVVGLGPYAGILALTLHSIAALGKLYSEAIESINPGPIEAIQATGATWLQTVVYAVIPQIIPPFVSFTIYRWDINIRMSTVIGFVGGGGIGFLLAQYIRLLDYRSAGMAVWFIAITVAILDYVSAEIRARFV